MGKGETDYRQIASGFLNVIKDFGDIQAEKAKIQTDIMANEFKANRNFLWKIAEQNAERKSKLQFIQEFMANQGNQGNQINGMDEMNIDRPQIRIGGAGEPTLQYPSARDKEFSIKLGLNRISQKENKGMPLSPMEQKFKETYSGMVKTEEPSYISEFRTELLQASQRIQEGEDAGSIISELRQKYPGSLNMNIEYNLKEVGKRAKGKTTALRGQAIQALKQANYPITESNIKSAMQQLRGQ